MNLFKIISFIFVSIRQRVDESKIRYILKRSPHQMHLPPLSLSLSSSSLCLSPSFLLFLSLLALSLYLSLSLSLSLIPLPLFPKLSTLVHVPLLFSLTLTYLFLRHGDKYSAVRFLVMKHFALACKNFIRQKYRTRVMIAMGVIVKFRINFRFIVSKDIHMYCQNWLRSDCHRSCLIPLTLQKKKEFQETSCT